MYLTAAQLKKISVLVSQLHINPDQKKVIVSGFTGGRTETSKELYPAEATDMIRHLNSLFPEEKKKEKVRRAFFPVAYEMGWGAGEPEGRRAKVVAKMIDGWCKKQTYKKGFNECDLRELGVLLTVFKEKVLKGFLKGI